MSKITIDELRRAIETDEITTVVCAMPDLCGRMVGKRLTERTFLETALGAEGLHGSLYLFTLSMEMWPQPGYEVTTFDTGLNDCLFLPDLDAIRITPWLERTAMVICDPCYEGTDTPLEVGPRNILKREIAKAARHGITAKFASELEFFLFQDSYEAAWDKGYRELDPTSRYNADYHILQSTKLEPIVRQIRDGMEAAGIEIEFSKTEWGLGQQEINLKYADTLEMADRHMLYKHGVKEIAALNGMSASFMAKLWKDEIGSSCHLHTSLWDTAGKTALCWDESRPGHISERFGHFLGGLLGTARELTALYAPNVNSYKRFEPLSMAPVQIALGDDNRSCGFRLCGEHGSFRVENRIPGADVNPYLGIAATLAAGTHGVANKLPVPEIYRGNAYDDETLPKVATTLYEAIAEFDKSALAKEMLGDVAYGHLLNFARVEQASFDNEVVTDWERNRYFERV